MIDRDTIDRIFSAANIAEVVGDFVTLKKKGVNYQACCPFHNEKTPSFVVSPSKGLFKCFGCGKGGNAVTFVMEHEKMGYVDALKYVAKKYNIEVQERELSPDEVRRNDDRESMMVATSFAAEYFKDILHNSTEGQNIGLAYFRERGFSDATIQEFELGFSPSGGDTFSQAALKAGYKEEFLISTGLTIKRDDGSGFLDRFRERVMFPIHNISGRVIAFGGRTLRTDKKLAKYVNSPESEIYHKSNVLYGLFQSKKAISQEDCSILVEGYTDVISMHQAGVKNVVASSGTSLTTDQIRLISRFTKNVTVIYDGDAAGIKASIRGIDMILAEGLNVRVVLLPDGDDPDSFARKNNSAQFQEYIRAHEEDFISFKARLLMDEAQNDPIKRAALITDMVDSISVIPDPISRSVFAAECARTMGIQERVLVEEIARRNVGRAAGSEAREFVRTQQRMERQAEALNALPSGASMGSSCEEVERELIKYLLKYGDKTFDYKEGKEIVQFNVADVIISDLLNNSAVFSVPQLDTVFREYVRMYENGESVAMHHFINYPDPVVCDMVVGLLTSDDNYVASSMWKKHDIIVESEEQRLGVAIPRTIIIYKCKIIEGIIKQLTAKLCEEGLGEEDAMRVSQQISALNKERISISKKLSRLII